MGFQFHFNPPNFGLGFIAGILATIAARRAIVAADNMRRSLTPTFTEKTYATTRGDRRYTQELIELAQRNHLFGDRVPLTEILLEPRFIPRAKLASMPDLEDAARDIWEVLPSVQSYPYLEAAYNIPTLNIADLGRGDRTIAILGGPGSGRTTALMAIALYAVGQVSFKKPVDAVQQEIEEQESELDPDDLAERIKNRVRMAHQARVRVAQMKGEDYSIEEAEADEDEYNRRTSPLRRAAPIYVHLANVPLVAGSEKLDPAEPLVQGVRTYLSAYATRTSPGKLYRMINGGHAVLLIDGYDDMPPERQKLAREWIGALAQIHPDNFIFVTAGTTGYGWLEEGGFAPVTMRPWDDAMMGRFADNWLEKWETISGTSLPPDDVNVDLIRYHSRGLSAFDTTLKTWALFANQEDTNAVDRIDYFLRGMLEDYEAVKPTLAQIASLQLENGFVTLEMMHKAEMSHATFTVEAGDGNKNVASPDTEEAAEEPEQAEDVTGEESVYAEYFKQADVAEMIRTHRKHDPKNAGAVRRTLSRIVTTLEKAGLVRRYRDGKLQFTHLLVASYLASFTLEEDEARMADVALDPAWHHAIGYASHHTSIEPAVQTVLMQSPDLLMEQALKVTTWLAYTPEGVTWRNELLRHLGNWVIAPNQFSVVREHITAALVTSRDPGAVVIFRRMLQHPNAEIRRLGCFGLGAMRDLPATNSLIQRLEDEDEDVQIAATMALGAIGTDEALYAVVDMMRASEHKDVRRAAAETLAGIPDTGYFTLYDSINEQDGDIMLRRAVLFGLGRIDTNWALIKINEVLSNPSEEYYVRSAATEVFSALYYDEIQGIHAFPQVGSVPWLLEWSQEPIEAGEMPHDVEGIRMLEYALESSDSPLIRVLAAQTAAQLGVVDLTRPLYSALSDEEPLVRDSAYRSLAEFQVKTGQPLAPPA